jgi:3-methylfumaryl-CoA hydratase
MTDSQSPAAQGMSEIPTASIMRKIAAMLDLPEPSPSQGEVMPRGWHFALLPATTLRSQLRSDGFAGLGVNLPDLGLPRLMLAARHVDYGSDMLVGEAMERHSSIESIEHKGTPERPRALLKVRHTISHAGQGAGLQPLVETQTFMLMPPGNGYIASDAPPQEVTGQVVRSVKPDATLLFHFSALGFNAHKIHLDRTYAREVEGFPDLVVNGGLIALLVTEFARTDLGLKLATLDIQYRAPLFADRLATIAADSHADGAWLIRVHNESGTLAAQAKVTAA